MLVPPKANKINLFQWRQSFSVLRNHSINYSSPPSNIGLEISTQNIAKKHGRLPVYAVWPPQPPNVCRYSLAGVLVWYQYTNADIDTASADVWDRNPHYVINTSVLATQPRAQHSNRFYFSIDGSICYSMDQKD